MVIEDLSYQQNKTSTPNQPAGYLSRFLAGVFDILLFSPIVTFVPSFHVREVRMDYAQGFDSSIWIQIFVLGFLTHVLLQTLFLYLFKATPGQAVMGIRVKPIGERLTWNQALLRSVFYSLSWAMLGLPLLEVYTHPMRRCWHDRVSDTFVVETKSIPLRSTMINLKSQPAMILNPQAVRAIMILGFFFFFLGVSSFVNQVDGLSFAGNPALSHDLDTLVAKALLKKDNSEETQAEVDEKLWNAKTTQEKALAYFYRFQNEDEDEARKALSDQICEWKASSLCLFTQYLLEPTAQKLTEMASLTDQKSFLSAQVAVMRELTRTSHIGLALNAYDRLKNQPDLKDEIRIWDVSLFLKIREQSSGNRVPASEDSQNQKQLKEALKKFEEDRGEP